MVAKKLYFMDCHLAGIPLVTSLVLTTKQLPRFLKWDGRIYLSAASAGLMRQRILRIRCI